MQKRQHMILTWLKTPDCIYMYTYTGYLVNYKRGQSINNVFSLLINSRWTMNASLWSCFRWKSPATTKSQFRVAQMKTWRRVIDYFSADEPCQRGREGAPRFTISVPLIFIAFRVFSNSGRWRCCVCGNGNWHSRASWARAWARTKISPTPNITDPILGL